MCEASRSNSSDLKRIEKIMTIETLKSERMAAQLEETNSKLQVIILIVYNVVCTTNISKSERFVTVIIWPSLCSLL